jgi:hypothetical protein
MKSRDVDVGPDAKAATARPRFLVQAAGILGVLLALGTLPTVRLAGKGAVPAMLAGCALSVLASLAGAVPIWRATNRPGGRPPQELLPAMLGSIVLRFAAALVLAVAAVLSGWFATKPLLIWLAISYAGLLAVDVRYARSRLGA